MDLAEYRIQMYKCVIDSGWVKAGPLSVLVGKNEAGKTTLLKALHKFNPFVDEPYDLRREWPRGHRESRNSSHAVCTCKFILSKDDKEQLGSLTGVPIEFETLDVSRDYACRFEVHFPDDISPDKLHPHDVDEILKGLPSIPEQVGDTLRQQAEQCSQEAKRLANEGRFSQLEGLKSEHDKVLRKAFAAGNPEPHGSEEQYTSQYGTKLQEVASRLKEARSIHEKAHEYVVGQLPTFVFMDEYRAFRGTAWLDQVVERRERKQLSEDDRTLLTILKLAHLSIDELVQMGREEDREERQYDLDDGAVTLTKKIKEHWGQLEYEVKFGADGQQFFTWVKGRDDRALIRLEERSRGFQWFFSFDLLLMHETQGRFEECVILLDEPGLHLHPEGQRDLLGRLEEYARGNKLIYTTHLPFMIDLQEPDRIRILSETFDGTVVTEDLTESQPEGKLTLQAALGMSGRTSFLVADENLVVEGVDDYWYLTVISNLAKRSGMQGLPEELMITAAGGASEVTYIATFMVGQELRVIALYDTDSAGNTAMDKLVKNWLVRYKMPKATALSIGSAVRETGREFAIEDLFTEDFYLSYVSKLYKNQLAGAGITKIVLKARWAAYQACRGVLYGCWPILQQGFNCETDMLRHSLDVVVRKVG